MPERKISIYDTSLAYATSLQPPVHLIAYRTVLSTNSLSKRPTSLLKASLACQQSSGLRSFSLKHCTNSAFTFSTAGSSDSSFFRFSNLAFSSAISLETLVWLRSALRCFSAASPVTLSRSVGDSSDDGDDSESCETLSEISLSLSASSAARRSSSEVTRDCIFNSRSAERVLSDWGLSCSDVVISPEKRVGVFLL